MFKIRKLTAISAAGAAMALVHLSASAVEGGVSIALPGAESSASSALPPPGFYYVAYFHNYYATSVKDHNGNKVTGPGFKIDVNALVNRFVWVTPVQVAGGSLALQAVLPVAHVSVDAAPGISQTRSGLTDSALGIGIGWHFSEKLHALGAIDLYMPTGSYNKNAIANTGTNRWAISPMYSLTYIQKEGITWDLRNTLMFNTKNNDTRYRSGIEWFADYTLGWAFGNGFTAGANGYVYQQLTNDKLAGETLPNSKSRAVSIGPYVSYAVSNGFIVSAKFEREFNVRNRAEGRSFWIRTVYAF